MNQRIRFNKRPSGLFSLTIKIKEFHMQDGQALVEYAVIFALVIIVVLITLRLFGISLVNVFMNLINVL